MVGWIGDLERHCQPKGGREQGLKVVYFCFADWMKPLRPFIVAL